MFDKIEIVEEDPLMKVEYTFTLIGIDLLLERYSVSHKNNWEKWVRVGQYDRNDRKGSTRLTVLKLNEKGIEIPDRVKEKAKQELLKVIRVLKESEITI